MNAAHFDRLTRTVRNVSSRRGLMHGLAVACGLAAIHAPDAMAAKKKKKDKNTLKRNQYGCVNVGGKCRGKDKNCCSGRCQGKKTKKGEKDKTRCVAHHTGTLESGEGGCRAQDDSYGPGDTFCTTTAGKESGKCWRTTGNAGYCGYGVVCVPCRKDAECIDGCGEGAACIVAPGGCLGDPRSETFCSGTALCDEP